MGSLPVFWRSVLSCWVSCTSFESTRKCHLGLVSLTFSHMELSFETAWNEQLIHQDSNCWPLSQQNEPWWASANCKGAKRTLGNPHVKIIQNSERLQTFVSFCGIANRGAAVWSPEPSCVICRWFSYWYTPPATVTPSIFALVISYGDLTILQNGSYGPYGYIDPSFQGKRNHSTFLFTSNLKDSMKSSNVAGSTSRSHGCSRGSLQLTSWPKNPPRFVSGIPETGIVMEPRFLSHYPNFIISNYPNDIQKHHPFVVPITDNGMNWYQLLLTHYYWIVPFIVELVPILPLLKGTSLTNMASEDLQGAIEILAMTKPLEGWRNNRERRALSTWKLRDDEVHIQISAGKWCSHQISAGKYMDIHPTQEN